MNDWCPGQDAKQLAFLANFAATIDQATIKLPADTVAAAKQAAGNWLAAYAARQDAHKTLDAALAVLQKQAPTPRSRCGPSPSR